MPEKPRILGLIPARGGSKGLPGKNLRDFCGKPLIAWTIEAALQSGCIDRVVVSSDDEEILRAARTWGAETPFVRPARLAEDATPGIDVVLHALDQLPGFDWVALLQPTSPLRTAADISALVGQCLSSATPCCVSVVATEHSPWWSYTLDADRLHPVMGTAAPARRQDLCPTFALNGAIYLARTAWLRATRTFLAPDTQAYVMPRERSVDIDDQIDLIVAEALLRAQA